MGQPSAINQTASRWQVLNEISCCVLGVLVWNDSSDQYHLRPHRSACGFGQELADGSSPASIINEAFSINRPERLVTLWHGSAQLKWPRWARDKEQRVEHSHPSHVTGFIVARRGMWRLQQLWSIKSPVGQHQCSRNADVLPVNHIQLYRCSTSYCSVSALDASRLRLSSNNQFCAITSASVPLTLCSSYMWCDVMFPIQFCLYAIGALADSGSLKGSLDQKTKAHNIPFNANVRGRIKK